MSELLDIEKAAQRKIKSIQPYLHLIPRPDFVENIEKDGDVMKTVRLMRDIVFKYFDDTKRLAPLLKGKTTEETCRNVWDFWYWHVQYGLDKGEQLRRPARTLYEQLGDCDCFSIGVCQTLLHLHIDNDFAVAKYYDEKGEKGKWQHVYVTVPKPSGGYYTLDCVAHGFNKEQSYADKFNLHMTTLSGIPISVLSGFGNEPDDELFKILSGADFEEVDSLIGLGQTPGEKQQLDAIYKHLISTRDYIQKNPQSVVTSGGAGAHLQMLNYAIDKWNTPEREQALDLLELEEERWNDHNGASNLGHYEEDEIDGLGAPKSKKKFWSKVKDTVKKVKGAAKKVGKKVGEGLKNIGKALVRYNPLSLAIRGGFLLAMKINLLGMAKKLLPALMPEKVALAKGFTRQDIFTAGLSYKPIKEMFVDTFQGKEDKLAAAIIHGRATTHLAGFGALGEPATITAVVAAAAPIIKAASAINDAGGKDENGNKLPTDKGALVSKIKEWWTKTFGHEKVIAPETITDADKEPNDKVDKTGGSNTKSDSTKDKASDDSTDTDKTDPNAGGGWMKFKQFVKDNPAVIGIGVAAIGTGITIAIVSHNHKKAEAKKQALSGAKKKKRKALPPPSNSPVLL